MEAFEHYSLLLSTIARRMLGNRGDVEDLVQETYLRYLVATTSEIVSLKAYLTTILIHLCLDQRKSARYQREELVGLRPPVCDADLEAQGVEILEQREELAQAFSILFECLTPDERAAFLLHEVFAYSYEEVAQIHARRAATCRQLVHRAKTHLIERRPCFTLSSGTHQRFLEQFLAASEQGDIQSVGAPVWTPR